MMVMGHLLKVGYGVLWLIIRQFYEWLARRLNVLFASVDLVKSTPLRLPIRRIVYFVPMMPSCVSTVNESNPYESINELPMSSP